MDVTSMLLFDKYLSNLSIHVHVISSVASENTSTTEFFTAIGVGQQAYKFSSKKFWLINFLWSQGYQMFLDNNWPETDYSCWRLHLNFEL
jgi:hypothetical protein